MNHLFRFAFFSASSRALCLMLTTIPAAISATQKNEYKNTPSATVIGLFYGETREEVKARRKVDIVRLHPPQEIKTIKGLAAPYNLILRGKINHDLSYLSPPE
jgi:hypothetical protein